VLLTIVGRQELSAKGALRIHARTDELRAAVADVLHAQHREAVATELGTPWASAVELGWTGVATPEASGGSGGDVRDLAVIATELAYWGHCAPITETAIAARTVSLAGRPIDASLPMTVGLAAGITCERRAELLVLNGRQARVPWARAADAIALTAAGAEGELLLPLRTAAAILGALRAAHASAREHVLVREQFGKPLAAFQAVAHNVARMAAEVVSAEVALEEALDAGVAGQGGGG
jgi:acyl-CoA dehydrogenase